MKELKGYGIILLLAGIVVFTFCNSPVLGEEGRPGQADVAETNDSIFSTTKKPRIVVIDFENTNKFAQEREYGATVAAMIATALTKNDNVLLTENEQIRERIKHESKDIASLEKYEADVDVVLHGTVSLMEKEGISYEKNEKPQLSALIVDLRIADLKTKEALKSKDFKVDAEGMKNLRARIEQYVNEAIEDYLRPYSGHVKLLITGYRECDKNTDPRTLYDTFFSDKSLKMDREGVALEYRPLQKSEITEDSKRTPVDTIDKDYRLISKNFFPEKPRLESASAFPEEGSPLITGEYRFRLRIPGYETMEETVFVHPGAPAPVPVIFKPLLRTGVLELEAERELEKKSDADFMMVLEGKNSWNGRPIDLTPEERASMKELCKSGDDGAKRREKCLCAYLDSDKDDKLRLVWTPRGEDEQARYINKAGSGYGYLPEVASKIEGNSYVIENIPKGEYQLITIPHPKNTYGHFLLDAFMYQKDIAILEGSVNREKIIGDTKRGQGMALIFLDPFRYGMLVQDISDLRFLKEGYGVVSYGETGKISRYGEIVLTGLQEKAAYKVMIRSRNYDEIIEIPQDCEAYKACKQRNGNDAECRGESYPCFIRAELKSNLRKEIESARSVKKQSFIVLLEQNIDNQDPLLRLDAITALLSMKDISSIREYYSNTIVEKSVNNLTQGPGRGDSTDFMNKYCRIIENAAEADKEGVYSEQVVDTLKELKDNGKDRSLVEAAGNALDAVERGTKRMKKRIEKEQSKG